MNRQEIQTVTEMEIHQGIQTLPHLQIPIILEHQEIVSHNNLDVLEYFQVVC